MLSDALGEADGPELSAEPWSGPGDVRIQPGLAPGFGQARVTDMAITGPAGLPPRATDMPPFQPSFQPSGQPSFQAPFQPMPPQDAKRPAAKRMPELDEFPLVAQREYRQHQARTQASESATDASTSTGTNAGPRVYTPPPVTTEVAAPRKPGLFERLTGKGASGGRIS